MQNFNKSGFYIQETNCVTHLKTCKHWNTLSFWIINATLYSIMSRTVLLINPPIYDFAAYDFFNKPLGLLYLASFLRQAGYEIRYIDCLDRNHPSLADVPNLPVTRPNGTGKYYHETLKPLPAYGTYRVSIAATACLRIYSPSYWRWKKTITRRKPLSLPA